MRWRCVDKFMRTPTECYGGRLSGLWDTYGEEQNSNISFLTVILQH